MIAIIGSGRVARALCKALVSKGEKVYFGIFDPAKYQEAVDTLSKIAKVGTVEEAIAKAEMVILAIPYSVARQVILSVPNWGNRILIDVTNPLDPDFYGLEMGYVTSASEQLAKSLHSGRLIKAFGATSAENLENPSFPNGKVFLPVCGDDIEARKKVLALAKHIGFDAIDFGDLTGARLLEPFAMTLIHLTTKLHYGPNFAFGILKR